MGYLKTLSLFLCFLVLSAEVESSATVDVHAVSTIQAPRKYVPGVEDKAGYWIDYGITQAFDFSLASNVLGAVIKQSEGPARLFLFNMSSGALRSATIVSEELRFAISTISFSPDGMRIAVPLGEERTVGAYPDKNFKIWAVAVRP